MTRRPHGQKVKLRNLTPALSGRFSRGYTDNAQGVNDNSEKLSGLMHEGLAPYPIPRTQRRSSTNPKGHFGRPLPPSRYRSRNIDPKYHKDA